MANTAKMMKFDAVVGGGGFEWMCGPRKFEFTDSQHMSDVMLGVDVDVGAKDGR